MTAPSLTSVAVPAEHGGWSFTLEPAVLGLLVAPGVPGAALAGAALVAFLMRTPAKLALVDRRRDRRLPRTRLAERVVLAEAFVAAALLAVAAFGDARLWVPLGLAIPLLAAELWYDVRSRSRRLVPELAGTIGVGAVVAAIVLAGGEPWALAFALWAIVAARAVAAVVFVRLQLRRAKGQPHRPLRNDFAQGAAVAIAAGGAALDPQVLAGAVAIAVLAIFHMAAARWPPPKVAVLGAQQLALGLGVVLATALGVLAPSP